MLLWEGTWNGYEVGFYDIETVDEYFDTRKNKYILIDSFTGKVLDEYE